MKDLLLNYLANRLKEPSTYLGLGTFVTGLGVTVAPDYWQLIMGAGMGFGGALGTLLAERSK